MNTVNMHIQAETAAMLRAAYDKQHAAYLMDPIPSY